MAFPAYQAVSNAAGHSATTGTLSVPWPASHAVNDIALLFVETTSGTIALGTASGFVQLGTQQSSTGTSLAVFWCRATSTTMANPVLTAQANHQFAVIVTYRGCITTGNPFDTSSGNFNSTPSTTVTLPSVTTTKSDALIVGALTKSLDSTAAFATSPAVNGNLASIAERFDAGTISGDGGGIAVIEGTKATAGSTGTTAVTITSSESAYYTISLIPPNPTFTQAAYRFYEDGAETTSTAIDAQNTNITRTVNSNSNLQLRMRLQNDVATAGVAIDDYQLQYELNDSGVYKDVTSSLVAGIDSYSDAGSDAFLGAGKTNKGIGQSITGTGIAVGTAVFQLKITGSPTGNAVAKIYAHSGTFGTSSVPTGAALATSDNLDVSTLTTTFTLTTVAFSGANQIVLTNTTNYILTIEYAGGDASNFLDVGWDFSSPTHSGNYSQQNTGTSVWGAVSTADLTFYLYSTVGVPVAGYNSASLADGNATTNRLGAGTGSFVAGEISEDGLVDDHQITASNYTEYLYSLTLVSSALANNDTLDFRILRNGATTGLTYTVTPRITASKTGGGAASSRLTLLGVG